MEGPSRRTLSQGRQNPAQLLVLTLAGILVVVSLFAVPAASQTCTRDVYTSLPSAAVFPTDTLASAQVPTGRPVTKGHWSEKAQYSKYRPAKITPVANPSQTGCPHTEQGLVDWHDASTWTSGTVPTNGSIVQIPTGKRVLVSSCSFDKSFVFGKITIPAGSALILGDAPITIAAKGFNVQGQLLAGSPTCRLRNKITITLHGSRGAQALPTSDSAVKGIAVTGQIDIHGMQYFTTWSRLAMTAEPGDNYVFLQDMVNWQPGQSIFITTTELKDARDWHRNEVRTIVKVWRTGLDASVAAVQLDSPLAYRHYGGPEYQAEVGLLSRNIVVQGDAFGSEPTDTMPNGGVCGNSTSGPMSTHPCTDKYITGFGGHVQVMGATAQGRFSGVELYRMGQTNELGRYPLHWHLIGQTNSSVNYATDCSVHHSFFRCYTIHGTHGVRLAENTAYDAIGNCFYLSEDGVEENNTVQYNLAAHVHILGNIVDASSNSYFWGQYLPSYTNSSTILVPADMSAAPFYVTNMYNTIEGNAASGGWTGFSFPSLPRPTGNFKNVDNFNPANRPFRTPFRGNTAHSSGFWWGSASSFYFGGQMTYVDAARTTLTYTEGRSSVVHDTCADSTVGTVNSTQTGCWDLEDKLWLEIEDNKAFLTNRGLQAWGNRANIVRIEIHDAILSMNVFGQVWVNDMLMECRSSGHRPTWFAGCPGAPAVSQKPAWSQCNTRDFYFWENVGGFQWYDVGQNHIVQNSTFRNCRNDWSGCIYGDSPGVCSGSAVFTSLTHSDQFVPQLMQTTSGITYDNCNNLWRSSTKLTDNTGVTVSGRMQSWLDADGTAANNTFPGQRTMIGSAWADEWWKMSAQCQLIAERWVCPMAARDGAAALKFFVDPAREAQIGSTLCMNGGGANPCPVVGKATHFGRRNESLGVDIAVMGQLTGPIISSAGGWFIRYTAGTPNKITLGEIQVDPKDTLVLAFPYPAGTTFSITFEGASWCGTSWAVCTHPFSSVNSVSAVANGFGDTYYWDNAAQILYVRATMQPSTFGSPGTDAPWTSIPPPPEKFTRGGLTIPVVDSGPTLVIRATSCASNPCAPQPQVSVPAAITFATPSVTPSQTPSRSPAASPVSTKSPSSSPTRSPSSSPSRTAAASPAGSKSPSSSPTRSPSQTPSRTAAASPAGTRSPSATPTRSPSSSPSRSAAASPAGTKSPSATPSRSPGASPSGTPTRSPSRSSTPSNSPTPSRSASASPSRSVTPSVSTSPSPSSAPRFSGVAPASVDFDAKNPNVDVVSGDGSTSSEESGVIAQVSLGFGGVTAGSSAVATDFTQSDVSDNAGKKVTYGTSLGGGAQMNVTFEHDNGAAGAAAQPRTFAGVQFTLPEGAVKWTVDIKGGWPFGASATDFTVSQQFNCTSPITSIVKQAGLPAKGMTTYYLFASSLGNLPALEVVLFDVAEVDGVVSTAVRHSVTVDGAKGKIDVVLPRFVNAIVYDPVVTVGSASAQQSAAARSESFVVSLFRSFFAL